MLVDLQARALTTSRRFRSCEPGLLACGYRAAPNGCFSEAIANKNVLLHFQGLAKHFEVVRVFFNSLTSARNLIMLPSLTGGHGQKLSHFSILQHCGSMRPLQGWGNCVPRDHLMWPPSYFFILILENNIASKWTSAKISRYLDNRSREVSLAAHRLLLIHLIRR